MLPRVLFGIALAIVANGILLLVFSYGWFLQEPGVDRDFIWGFAWLASAIAAILLATANAFLVERWQRLVSWWAPSLAFCGLALAIAGIAATSTHLIFWLLS